MKQLVAGLLLCLATSWPAWATSSLTCLSDDGRATVYLNAFSGPEMVINSVEIIAQGVHWSTRNVDAEQMSLLQSFSDTEHMIIDLSDTNAEDIIARIRLFSAEEGNDWALAGTLQMPGRGAYAIVCEGP